MIIGTAALLAFALTGPAGAQDEPDPPCPPGTPAGVTIQTGDLEDNGGSPTATHTITVYVETAEGPVSEIRIAVSSGQVRPGGDSFRVDAPGPVQVVATWRDFQNAGFCTATAETTVNVEPAKPLRYIGPPSRSIQMNSLGWRVSFRDDADLRPLEMRLRGVRRARLPRASAPVQTVTFALREGDRGLSYNGRALRKLRSAGWRFQATFGHDERDIRIDMMGTPGKGRGFGIELELAQGGRVIGRTRAVGRCRYLVCHYRTVRR